MDRYSLNLWSIFNDYIGCEENIYIRRRKIFYWETLTTCINRISGPAKIEYVYGGSRGEGFNLQDSDFDYMGILKDVEVFPADYKYKQGIDILMETENIKPGFAGLRLSSEKILLMFSKEIVTVLNDCQYISSVSFRDLIVKWFSEDIPESHAHGPCSTHINELVGGENDRLLCFQSKIWPDVASEWRESHRPNNWPKRKLVNEIIADGCLFVPVGSTKSSSSFTEWRVSFSLSERKLVHSLNHTQFLCYGLLKSFLKYVINSNDTTKDLLCSYFMKTILFYVLEEEPLIWDKHHFLSCFFTCFKRLLSCVREGSCPNYFVRNNNMFEQKIVGVNKEYLLHYLSNLYDQHFQMLVKIPAFTLYFELVRYDPEFGSLPASVLGSKDIEYMCFIDFMQINKLALPKSLYEINIMQHVMQFYLSRATDIHDKEVLIACMYRVNYLKTQHLYQLYLSRYCSLCNKSRYRYLTMLRNHIVHTCRDGDICTGWLQYGTLCYLTGQYKKVIKVMDYVLSKFKPYTLVEGILKCSNILCFKETICGDGLSISQKRRISAALYAVLIPECEFYPREIKPEICDTKYTEDAAIVSLVYVNILKFLSCFRLGFQELGIQIIDKLDDILADDEFDSRLLPTCIDLVYKCRSITS